MRRARLVLAASVLTLASACTTVPREPPPPQLTARAPAPTLPPMAQPALPPAGPVWPHDFPDPAILFHDGVYYAYGTEGTLDARLQVLRSWDMVSWGPYGDALVDTPGWAEQWWSWAPAALALPDGILLYYSARHTAWGLQCISVADAEAPDGRFVDSSQGPLVCDRASGGAIDPSPFVDNDGARYLLWKVDGIAIGAPNYLASQELADDGLSLRGKPSVLLTAAAPWEDGQIEAPSMTRIGDTYYLVYSGNDWGTSRYAVGVARCEGPLGPCARTSDAPVLTSRDGARGPGGAEFFRDGEGRLMVAYHAWAHVGADEVRALFLDQPRHALGLN